MSLTTVLELPGGSVAVFQLLQMKAAIKMEQLGMKHSSGKSARKRTAVLMGMKPLTPHAEVISAIDNILY